MQLQTGVAQVAILAFSALLIIPNALQARTPHTLSHGRRGEWGDHHLLQSFGVR